MLINSGSAAKRVATQVLGIVALIAVLFIAGCASGGSAPFAVTTTSGQLAAVVISSAYPQTTLAAANGTAPYTWTVSAGALPAGMALSSGGVLSGTPTAFGSFPFTVTVTDSATPTPHTATASLSVLVNPAIASVALNPITVTGGTASTAIVTLNGVAAAAASVTLASGNAAAAVPATVTVAAGQSTATFQVTSTAVSTSAQATITATYGAAKTATLTVNPPTVASVALTLSTLTGGAGTTGTVTLTGPAATGGDSVTLASDNAAAQVPATVTVLAGQTSAQFAVTTTSVVSSATAHIQASFNSTSQSATLTVLPAPVATSFTTAAATITSGSSTTLTAVFSNGTGSVSNGVGAVTNGTPVSVSPTATTIYTLTVTNAANTTATKKVTVTVVPAPAITSFAPAAAIITAGGSTTLTAVFSNGTGSVDGSVGAVTSGTPVTVSPISTFTYTLTVTNAAGTAVTRTALVTVVPAPAITSFTSGAATIVTGNSTTLTAVFSGGTGSVDHGVGAVTSGTPVNISPTSTTTYTLTATNSATVPASVTATASVTVQVPPSIISGSSTTFAVGSASTFTVVSTANPTAALSRTGSLPTGVNFVDNGNGTATIGGTPGVGTTGSYPITITANNGVAPNGTQVFTLSVTLVQAPAITSANSVAFTAGVNSTFNLTATGSPAPAITKTGALPAGVNLTDNGNGTATISGTAAAPGSSPITITASNGTLPNATQSFTFTVVAAPSITSFAAAATTITAGTSTTLTGVFAGGTGNVNGAVGVVISGTPATVSPSNTTVYTLTVTNTATTPATATAPATVNVVAAPVITSFTATSATIVSGSSTTITPTFSNGTGSVNNGVGTVTSGTGVSVSPTNTTTYTLTVTNAAGSHIQSPVTITVNTPPQITSANNATFIANVNGTFTVTATGNPTPAMHITGSLPGGVTFTDNNNGTATITGTATSASVNPVTLTASNGVGSNATQVFTLSVTAVSCPSNCTISGTVTGPLVSGVTVALSGPASASTTTDNSGAYSFTGLAGAVYTVTPSLAGYTFSPVAPSVPTSGLTTTQNFTETSTVAAFSISGTLTYSGSKTGRTFVRVYNTGSCNNGGCEAAGTSLASAPTPGGVAFTVRGLQPGSYSVVAEVDTLNNGAPNASNPWGAGAAIVSSANVSGTIVNLTDPTPPAPVVPTNVNVSPGSGFALVQYDQNGSNTLQDGNGREIATTYRVSYATNSSFTAGLTVMNFAAHGTHDNVAIVSGISPGTYFFKITSLVGSTESAASATVGPVTIGPAGSGAFTVTGTVTFPVTATGPLYVGMLDQTNNVIYGTRIASPTSGVVYSISGVPAGTYGFFAILDQTASGLITGSINNVDNSQGGPPPITVVGNMTNNVTLTAPVTTINMTTNHQQFSGINDTYSLSLSVTAGTKRPVILSLLSGPNVPLPWDLPVDSNNGVQTPNFPNGVVPQVGDTYHFQVTYSDGTTQAMPVSISAVLNSFAQFLIMNTGSPFSTTVPQLNWTTPASPPTSYTYSVNLFNANGTAQESWNYSGSGNSNGIPSSQTNVLFNTDSSASPNPALTSGGTYDWSVTVQDANGNTAQQTVPYTVP